MAKMPPEVERLVRLMLMLPNDPHHELHQRLADESVDASIALAMRWYIGDAAKMWPPAGPRNLAEAVLIVFANPSEGTISLISSAISDEATKNTSIGAAWVEQVRAAAIDVLAFERPLEDILTEAREHWSLNGR
ncbi:hypothetical protein ABZ799_01105 [Nocardiopsis dassonvillei]|uniref:hypothetical protein n=1 Tax=Nocardiopsis dassonvillei TaxID=2014 RepID=UPI0033D76EAB